MMQSVIPAVYPILKQHLPSGLRPDRPDHAHLAAHRVAAAAAGRDCTRTAGPTPYSLPIGMGFTLVGLLLLSRRRRPSPVLLAVAMVGIGSSVFHPGVDRAWRAWPRADSTASRSRCSRWAATPGSSLGPLLAAFIVLPAGQRSIAWFSAAALLAIVGADARGRVVQAPSAQRRNRAPRKSSDNAPSAPSRFALAIAVLCSLIFSKYLLFGEPDQLLHVLPDQPGSTSRCRPRRCTCSCFSARSPRAPSSAVPSAIASAANT